MQTFKIIWADDEIDLLKPHILFLEQRGYSITPVNNGQDAIEEVEKQHFDIVFLDENMPGMSGLEVLPQIKNLKPHLPVVMITKSEEEHIMDEAIGAQIADYLIKPLNPNQILLSAKRILENKRLVSERTNLNYQQDFRNISMAFMDYLDHTQWVDIYKKLVYWELAINKTGDTSMIEVLNNQKTEANVNFTKYIIDNYQSWLNDTAETRPLLSHQLMKHKVFPHLKQDKPVFFILIDNLRYDQWKVIEPLISDYFNVESEDTYYSILPTTTAYARNAIFAGLPPLEMQKINPDIWVNEGEEEGKNNYEEEFLNRQLKRSNLQLKISYNKIKNISQGKQLSDNVNNLLNNDLNVIVYNFVDMLSHARTEMEVIRELAPDEPAYRSITRSWFTHSPLLQILAKIASKDVRLILTTDHGTIRVKKPFKIVGDRNTNTNLRFKMGKNLSFEEDKVFVVRKPEELHLPKANVSTSYVFAVEDYFFAYPNNYNYYVKYYDDTFQHGGISMEEMIIPVISLKSKII
ncbi:MAG: PglZ domain-containing protein [Cyclobacteriaceae bacterium]